MTELKVDLYRAMRRAGVSRAELMRRLGWQRTSVDRLFQIDHASKLEQVEAAFHALGLEVHIEVGESERV
jgi:antitoxin HicB